MLKRKTEDDDNISSIKEKKSRRDNGKRIPLIPLTNSVASPPTVKNNAESISNHVSIIINS